MKWLLYQVRLVHVRRLAVAEEAQNDRQRQTDFGGGDDDHEYRKDDPCEVLGVQVGGEGDEVDAHRLQHQFDGHQYEYRVAAGKNAVHPDREKDGTQDKEVVDRDHSPSSPRARTIAPIRHDQTSERSRTEEPDGEERVRHALKRDNVDLVAFAGKLGAGDSDDRGDHEGESSQSRERFLGAILRRGKVPDARKHHCEQDEDRHGTAVDHHLHNRQELRRQQDKQPRHGHKCEDQEERGVNHVLRYDHARHWRLPVPPRKK
jgi:hypothetical protein